MADNLNTNTVNKENSLYKNNSYSLHISGLPTETTEEDIFLFFKDYNVNSAKIVNKNSKTYAQAIFNSMDCAEKARFDLNGLGLIPRASQTGIIKPISISVLDSNNLKENMKKDLDRNLLVKNLSKNLSGREFYLMMRKFGDIKLCKLVVDYYGNSKGYGFVYYYDSSSAEGALKELQDKVIDQMNITVCNLIPGKTRDNYRNNIYVKNFPVTFSEEDLKKLFEKYGEIRSAIVSRDSEGKSRGFGFVCFANPGNANQAYRDIKEQNIQFPGLESLYLNYAQKKDERIEMLMKDSARLEQLTVFARLRDDMYLVKTKENFEKEIKDFLKLLLTEEYSPREIKIKMESKTALITMNSQTDLEILMGKYVDYCNYYLPRIFLNYYQNKNDRTQTHNFINQLNSMINPVNMFSNFKSLSIVDPNVKPIIHVNPNQPFPLKNNNQNQKNNNKNYHSKYKSKNYNQGYYKKNYYNNNYYYGGKNYVGKNDYYQGDGGQANNQNKSVLIDLDDKQSSSTPLYERETKEELASMIYDLVVRKYPENAGKITGMIIDLGLNEMKRLLEKNDQLIKIADEANDILKATQLFNHHK